MVEYPSEPFPPNLTWDEFLALPYELRNISLVDGEVIVNPPNAQHELVVRRLLFAFTVWMESGPNRGQVTTQQPVKINDRRGYQPDVLWFPDEHCAIAEQGLRFIGPPGIVIEIQSPSTRTFDLIRKRSDYDSIGIAEAWFIDPRPEHLKIMVCQRPEADGSFGDVELVAGADITSPQLEGFKLPVADLIRL